MNLLFKYIAVSAVLISLSSGLCRAQQNGGQGSKPMTFEEVITKQVEDMVDCYKLDDYQAFTLDTLLQHFAPIYNAELKKVKDSGAAQAASYQTVVDKWADFFDREYEKIFNEKQWKQYMKSAAGREKKKRDKRMEAARGESAAE